METASGQFAGSLPEILPFRRFSLLISLPLCANCLPSISLAPGQMKRTSTTRENANSRSEAKSSLLSLAATQATTVAAKRQRTQAAGDTRRQFLPIAQHQLSKALQSHCFGFLDLTDLCSI